MAYEALVGSGRGRAESGRLTTNIVPVGQADRCHWPGTHPAARPLHVTLTAMNLLEQQIAYYRARATEYERGLYSSDEAQALIEQVIERVPPGGDVLELACGTGVWTERLAHHAA